MGAPRPTERHVVQDDENDATLTEDSAVDTQAEVDWQKRYTDTQAEYTRNQQALADERKVWEDEQALLARVQEKFPHLMAEEEETEDSDDFDEDQPDLSQFATKKELEEFKSWRAGIDGERSNAMFERDLKGQIDLAEEIADDAVRGQVHDWIKDRTLSLGGTPKHLEQAVTEFRSMMGQFASKKSKSKPRAPHVPRGGNAASGVKDFSGMSRDEINAYMVERARALEAD